MPYHRVTVKNMPMRNSPVADVIPVGGGTTAEEDAHVVVLMFPQGPVAITSRAAMELAQVLPEVVAYLQANHPLKAPLDATSAPAESGKPVAPGFH